MKSPQFRVVSAPFNGAVLVMNAQMRDALIDLLDDLVERSTHETALMHALREQRAGTGPSGKGGRRDE